MSCRFGQSIESVMANDQEKEIPTFVKQTLTFLNTRETLNGLFRVNASVKDVDKLKSEFESTKPVDLEKCDPFVVAQLIKGYFIALPEPLLTFAAYDKFIEAADSSDCVGRMKIIFQELPRANKLIAGCLFLLLSRIAEAETESVTAANNLAIYFAQIMLRPEQETLVCLLRHSPKITALLKCLIENHFSIIPVDESEGNLIRALISPAPPEAEIILTPQQQKLKNIKFTVDDSIKVVFDRLDEMSKELANTTSLEETIEIAKRVRTAKRFLFAKDNEAKTS